MGETRLQFPEGLFGEEVGPGQWLGRISKLPRERRPVILSMDDGIVANSLSRAAMKECGSVFVFLAKAWSNEPWESLAWRILKVWPELVREMESCHAEGRECRIQVSINGKLSRINL